MLPFPQQITFVLFAAIALVFGLQGFHRLYLRVQRGIEDPEPRFDTIARRIGYALATTLTQKRTFRKRPTIGLFHSFIFYGFVFYLLSNAVDVTEGYFPIVIHSNSAIGAAYNLFADILSLLVLLGVLALVVRRFALHSGRDFHFNKLTLLHESVRQTKIGRDSLIVSAFIVFHVGSRAMGAAARVAAEGPDRFQPFATFLARFIPPTDADAIRIAAYWGAFGSILVFLAYFPYTKHIHIFMAPAKYLTKRKRGSGVLPPITLDLEPEEGAEPLILGASQLEDLAWPRLLDAYACIQCNRCQDVCPATATGKSLSPAALEINKRMELNELTAQRSPFALTRTAFEAGSPSPRALLTFALSPEAAWACTTCGACMEVCPVQDEQMLDIIDIRRNQVLMEGRFPAQLQSAFRGMERNQNPWGINREHRLDWADSLSLQTIEENPTPDVLYWVGCAASYDPQAQKTARAVVGLLRHAQVNFAVLGKEECCTGDTARRAGNEYLYRQLAEANVSTLNRVRPKLIVASCPHCMNAIGNEYKQIGGDYHIMHHTEYLETLVASKRLRPAPLAATLTYHDPCYLGRHNGVYDAPRNLLSVLGNKFVELGRNRENAFCCGAGGAQFWKEEEAGDERIAENRFREVQQTFASATGEKVLAVGCPFCKSMLHSARDKFDSDGIAIRDVAELLLEAIQVDDGGAALEPPCIPAPISLPSTLVSTAPAGSSAPSIACEPDSATLTPTPSIQRKKWPATSTTPLKKETTPLPPITPNSQVSSAASSSPERKKWKPRATVSDAAGAQGMPHPQTAQPATTIEDSPMAPATVPAASSSVCRGCDFLLTDSTPAGCFFPEDFTVEHKQIAQVTADFAANEVMPVSDQIEAKNFTITRQLIQEAGKLGLTAVGIPEEYGGLNMDKVTSAIIADNMVIQGSFSVTFSGHVGIGTLPIVWYGTPEQKRKYLPHMAEGTLIGAYALSESGSGSDATNAHARAVLSEDGRNYVLNGEKMWITNAGFADLFTVFAKCEVKEGNEAGKEKLTAFLIEKGTPGLAIGKEEHKLGIRGSSTCALLLTDCIIPKENLLGEVGKGHHIAFNILNAGRYKLGNSCVGTARLNLDRGVRYANERMAFGKPISEFGLIQEKLANCAVDIFAGEALAFRTVGLIDAALSNINHNDTVAIQDAIETYAVECSIVKVWATEMLDRVIDEVLQIHGGYGFVEEYPIERAYRDSRINRIFEGTNEINRLVITGRLMKSAMQGKLPLLPAIKKVMDEAAAGVVEKANGQGPLAEEHRLLAEAKKLMLFVVGAAMRKHIENIADEQEIVGSIADIVIEIFAMESAILRVEKMAKGGSAPEIPAAMARIYAAGALEKIDAAARKILAEIDQGGLLRGQLALFHHLGGRDLLSTISLRRKIAKHLIKAGKYSL